jgi:hypothetical protein
MDVAALKTVSHERFVQEYVVNGNKRSLAYALAFPKSKQSACRQNALRLLKKPAVRRRIAELQNKGARRTEITLERLITEADDIQRKALAAKRYAAAVAALIAKAKLAGFMVERFQGGSLNVHYVVADAPPSEEDWQRQHVTAY